MADTLEAAVRKVGPPPPLALTAITRIFELLTLVLFVAWVFGYLGGVALHPVENPDGSNDTGKIYNWHPLLMALAFPFLMAEALLAYRAPVAPANLERSKRKQIHYSLHMVAVVLIILAVVAVIKSHTLKRPVPTPNFYSPHSYLGIFTLVMVALQLSLGTAAFLYPKFSQRQREALVPVHQFLGRATFVSGLAAMAAGIQEKTGFVIQGQMLSGSALFSTSVSLPSAIMVVLAITGALVLFHHAESPSSQHLRDEDALLQE